MLTLSPKQTWVEYFRGFLDLLSEDNDGFWRLIINGGEICVHRYKSESKLTQQRPSNLR